MINTKKAFTLVELIVVITILAILGTIAFISLQGYSSDARNSKRVNNLNSIQTAISVQNTNGTSLMSFITGTANALSGSKIAGTGTTINDYNAGIINYTAIGIKPSDFKDPQNNDEYRIGVTTYKDGNFEIAASIENGAGNRTAKIIGNYIARDPVTIINANSTGTLSVNIKTSDINKFMRGDYIGDGTNTGKIVSVSKDLSSFTTDTQMNNLTLTLANVETKGLILSTTTNTPVSNGSENVPY